MEQKQIQIYTLKQNIKMTAGDFYSKWNIHISTATYYKKRFPEFVTNKKLDYKLLDDEFLRRIEIKENAKKILYEARGIEIEDCFEGENRNQIACHWLRDLYLDFVNDKKNIHLISDKKIDKINKVVDFYTSEILPLKKELNKILKQGTYVKVNLQNRNKNIYYISSPIGEVNCYYVDLKTIINIYNASIADEEFEPEELSIEELREVKKK